MSKDTNRYGEPIAKVTLEEVIDEFSKWDRDSLITCCASLMVVHHAEEYERLIKQLRKEFNEGNDDEVSITY